MEATAGLRIRLASKDEVQVSASILEDVATWCVSQSLRAWDQGVFHFPSGRGLRRLSDWQASGSLHIIWLDSVAVGTFALLTQDPVFWPNAGDDALYLHQFGVRVHGLEIGRFAMGWMRAEAQFRDRKYVRLDCLGDNPSIRRYYETAGFDNRGELVIDEIRYALYEMAIDAFDRSI
jgi:hypothetical protein